MSNPFIQSLKQRLLEGKTINLYPNTEEDTYIHSLVENIIDGVRFVFTCIDTNQCQSDSLKPCCSIKMA